MKKKIPKVPREKRKGTYLFPPSRLDEKFGKEIKKKKLKDKIS